ncbi:hypothetical protein ACMFMG_001584 [Clarireedia jacksonii]
MTSAPDKDNILADLKALGIQDADTLLHLFGTEITGVQNDNSLLLEKLVQLLARQPPSSTIGKTLTATFVNTLWSALPHPPLASLGTQYKYREADGSNNNIRAPDLGRAGSPYARTVKASFMQSKDLPDPGELFDTLMSRGEGDEDYVEHPTGISSVLFYLATIIIHDLFLTDHYDQTRSKTSSYLDLAPLYGCDQDEQNAVRTFADGKLKPDCFSSKRILSFPPGAGVMLIMFNRFHNYVVGMLAQINDNNRFSPPPPNADKAAILKYDNDLFQTGRLITCGLYVNIVLKDYVRTILNLNRTSSTWDLDPRVEETKNLLNTPAAAAVGNQVSAEFNLIYRWHSAVSRKDEEWTKEEYAKLFPGKNPADVTIPELLRGLQTLENNLPNDPQLREFAGLKRTEQGSFSDDELVRIFSDAVEDRASAFGANRIPPILRSIEILSIQQSRYWNMATLNEFRKFVGLTPHTTFSDINPSPYVSEKLAQFYPTPDHVELYPGIVVEKTKPPVAPGSGLCVGYSISYAILSDAVALVRGDRFYTEDYTPGALTAWGYNLIQPNLSIDAGCVMHKLVLRAFPSHFAPNSIYAHYPFVTPSVNHEIQTSLDRKEMYSFERPKLQPELLVINDWQKCKEILSDSGKWKVGWGEAIEFLSSTGEKNDKAKDSSYCLAGDGKVNDLSRGLVTSCFYPSTTPTTTSLSVSSQFPSFNGTPNKYSTSITNFYKTNFVDLLTTHRIQVSAPSKGVSNGKGGKLTYRIDIVKQITQRIFTRFAAAVFDIPLITSSSSSYSKNRDGKDGGNENGKRNEIGSNKRYTEEELYKVLELCFVCIFENLDVTTAFEVNIGAQNVAGVLGKVLEERAREVSGLWGMIEGVEEKVKHLVKDAVRVLLRRVNRSAKEDEDRVQNGTNNDKKRQEEEEKYGNNERKEILNGYGKEMISRFLHGGEKLGWDLGKVVWEQLLPTAASMTANQSQVLSQVLEFYLSSPVGKEYLPRLYELAHMKGKESDEELMRFFLEGARLNSTVGTVRYYKPSDAAAAIQSSTSVPSSISTPSPSPIQPTLLNLPLAHHSPSIFPSPENVDLTRPLDTYLMFGWGRHACIGREIALMGMVEVFRGVVGLKGVRLDSRNGVKGIKKVRLDMPGGLEAVGYLDNAWGSVNVFPQGLSVLWDE